MATLAPELLSADLDEGGLVGPFGAATRDGPDRGDETGRVLQPAPGPGPPLRRVADHLGLSGACGRLGDTRLPWTPPAAPAGWLQAFRLWTWRDPATSSLTAGPRDADGLVAAARRSAVPLAVKHVEKADLDALGATTIVVRPDQIVAWCGDLAAADAVELPTRLAGRPTEARASS